MKTVRCHKSLFLSLLAIAMVASLTVTQESYAASSGCTTKCQNAQNGFTSANTQQSSYTNGGLGIAHMLIKMLNSGFGNIPLDVVNHFIYDMSMPTTNLTLPFDATKTFTDQSNTSNSVELTVTSPTEAFATTLGYTLKAVVKYDNVTFMDMWWGGNGTTAKGFLIMHSTGFNPNNAMYIQFDLTNPAAQTIKVFGDTAATAVNPLGTSNDNVMYGRLVFNANTNAVTMNMIFVQNSSGTIQCHRAVLNSGSTLGGTLNLSFNTNGSPLTSSGAGWATTDSTGFVSFALTDSTSTASNAGTSISPTIALDYSCSQVRAAVQSGGVLANGDTSDSITPSAVFPN